MAESKTKKAEEVKEEKEEAVIPAGPEQEKTVIIKIPLDRTVEEDPVVWVNNRRYIIKRGVPVEVPESVAEILANQEKMLQYCYDYEQAHAK